MPENLRHTHTYLQALGLQNPLAADRATPVSTWMQSRPQKTEPKSVRWRELNSVRFASKNRGCQKSGPFTPNMCWSPNGSTYQPHTGSVDAQHATTSLMLPTGSKKKASNLKLSDKFSKSEQKQTIYSRGYKPWCFVSRATSRTQPRSRPWFFPGSSKILKKEPSTYQ